MAVCAWSHGNARGKSPFHRSGSPAFGRNGNLARGNSNTEAFGTAFRIPLQAYFELGAANFGCAKRSRHCEAGARFQFFDPGCHIPIFKVCRKLGIARLCFHLAQGLFRNFPRCLKKFLNNKVRLRFDLNHRAVFKCQRNSGFFIRDDFFPLLQGLPLGSIFTLRCAGLDDHRLAFNSRNDDRPALHLSRIDLLSINDSSKQ